MRLLAIASHNRWAGRRRFAKSRLREALVSGDVKAFLDKIRSAVQRYDDWQAAAIYLERAFALLAEEDSPWLKNLLYDVKTSLSWAFSSLRPSIRRRPVFC
jgi:hypothetical protein